MRNSEFGIRNKSRKWTLTNNSEFRISHSEFTVLGGFPWHDTINLL